MNKSLVKFFRSFACAFQGIRDAFGQRNMRLHGLATIIVISASYLWKISIIEWIVVLLLIGLVWAAEILNTCIEDLANLIRDYHHLGHQATRSIRDMAAGAVLVLAFIAALIGYLIFWPRLIAQPLPFL